MYERQKTKRINKAYQFGELTLVEFVSFIHLLEMSLVVVEVANRFLDVDRMRESLLEG